MVNDNLSNMLKQYPLVTDQDKENALKEIIQNISLLGLQSGNFFKKAAFYGGTALRICHGLDRFSEDLDFCLLLPDPDFTFKPYFSRIHQALENYGFNAELSEKEKRVQTAIKSAFVKQNTYSGLVTIGLAKSDTNPEQKIKIKLEIDTQNPTGARFENKLVLNPIPFQVNVLDIPSLFAGKLHAILAREFKNRVKGRDFYDWIYYVQKNSKVNIVYLQEKLLDSGHLSEKNLDIEILKELLHQKIDKTDFDLAREDVRPFISSSTGQASVDNWDKDLFHALVNRLESEV